MATVGRSVCLIICFRKHDQNIPFLVKISRKLLESGRWKRQRTNHSASWVVRWMESHLLSFSLFRWVWTGYNLCRSIEECGKIHRLQGWIIGTRLAINLLGKLLSVGNAELTLLALLLLQWKQIATFSFRSNPMRVFNGIPYSPGILTGLIFVLYRNWWVFSPCLL